MTAALGNVNVAPGGVTQSPLTTNKELLASSVGWAQDGVTLAVGNGVLAVGTPLAKNEDGFYGPAGGETPENRVAAPSVTFTDTGDLVTTPSAHGLSVGDEVKVASVTTTTGITANTVYYVLTVPTSTTLTLSATNGGSTLALTTNGTGGALTEVAETQGAVASVSGFLRREVDTGVSGDIPKFGNRVYKGTLNYANIKAANGNADLTGPQLTALNARIDADRNYLIF